MSEKKKKSKKQKKVKVEYDVKVDDKNTPIEKNFTKANVIMLALIVVVEALLYYFVTPAINIQSPGFWIWIILTLAALMVASFDFKVTKVSKSSDLCTKKKLTGGLLGSIIVLAIVFILSGILSSKLFNAHKYASLINVQEGTFTEDIVESENVNDIALMDTDTARIIGDRAIGSLSDVVSQYEVSEAYSTIDLDGKPMKVASLEYAGFIKYCNNRNTGIPGYVLVDPVKNEATYVKLDKPIRYSTSACFNENLQRHVQLAYPTKIFEGYYFELDNEGNPYYICPVLKSNAGIFGAKDVCGTVICDPCSGDTQYYDVKDVPGWVDRVYDGNLVCAKYDWYGTLSGGFVNSVIGNKGCKVTTDDYGYKVMNGDVCVYTGVTSVNGDESNIGFILSNLRTGETKYFSIAGAEEYSAMDSAEGQVQHLGYEASFPSLININGIPTYIMVLKDNAGLVKMYALVNVEKYNIVATGTTQKEALAAYKKQLVENGIGKNSNSAVSGDGTDDMGMVVKDVTVKDIKFIAVEGNTTVYITDEKGNVYKQDFNDNESLILIQNGDKIKVHFYESEDGINELYEYEK